MRTHWRGAWTAWPALALAPLLAGCGGQADPPLAAATHPAGPPALAFTDVTTEAGIVHRHHPPVLDSRLDNIMPWVTSVGAAAAAGDYNRDGWVDLYVTDSRKGEPNRLYRNNGDGTFTDAAPEAGVAFVNGEAGTSMDCVWGDVDNDGWPDLYLVRWGRDALFRNQGDGTFREVTEARFQRRDGTAGSEWANGNAAIFLDYDRDGRLDLYVGNYFREDDLWHLADTRIMHDDFERARNGGENFLFHQEADGSFTEVARSMGVEDPGWTLAVGAADVNNDGWPDLYSADDFGPDQLFINDRQGGFVNATETALRLDTKKGMNVDFGDFNNDGWLDVYVTNITTAEYLQEGNMLWQNNGPGPGGGGVTFTDVSLETGTYDGGWGWGAKFFDADDDGDLDLVSANGFISAGPGSYWYDLASWTVTDSDPADARNWPAIGDRSFSGFEPMRFWRNDGFGVFSERAREVGLISDRDGRGVVAFDYDNDGDLDLYFANQNQEPNLFRNDLDGQHWLEVALVADPATGVNRDGVGARVIVVAGGEAQARERDGGNGFSSQSDPRLHFGLGAHRRVDWVEVRWPDGGVQHLDGVEADRLVELRQDPARYGEPRPWPAAVSLRLGREPAVAGGGPEAAASDPEVLERELAELEGDLRRGLSGGFTSTGFTPASRYRARCVEAGQYDRAITFFQQRVEAQPQAIHPRLELAAALIDKIPTCGGVAAVVCKGTLARRALDQLDAILDDHPDWWPARYSRGINHLHWPRALRHSDDAAADLELAVELQRRAGDRRPYYLRTYVALGDAYTKDGRYDQAREAWRRGLAEHPGAEALETRLAITDDDALLEYVEDQRSLEQPIDTDLSFLDG